jgi:glucose-like phosphotransferase system IIB component
MDSITMYIILGVVFLIILLAILKATKKDAHLEMNKLLEYLGGKDNIIETESNLSRFKVTLKDVSKANKEAITKMGAKGIVEIGNELKIILGPESKQLKKYINSLQGNSNNNKQV